MASLSRDRKSGAPLVQFTDRDNRRRTVRLGGFTKKAAESVRAHIELLNTAAIGGHAPDEETAR